MIADPILNSQQICCEYLSGIPIRTLAKIYKSSHFIVRKILVTNNINIRTFNTWTRKYTYDRDFFKKIDTEEKAYWLGFLYADGCIAENSVNLLLHQKDIDILEKFKKSIKFTGPIEIRNDKINYGDKYGIKISHTAKVRISSSELRSDLIKLGCIPRKTFILKFPDKNILPDKLVCHFIRGYFDGDGSVYERKYKRMDGNKRGFAQITSSNDMINSIRNILIDKFDIKNESISVRDHPASRGISILMLCSIESMKIFRDILYNNASIFMDRKKIKFYDLNLDKINNYK